jgi:hypothetical protein
VRVVEFALLERGTNALELDPYAIPGYNVLICDLYFEVDAVVIVKISDDPFRRHELAEQQLCLRVDDVLFGSLHHRSLTPSPWPPQTATACL